MRYKQQDAIDIAEQRYDKWGCQPNGSALFTHGSMLQPVLYAGESAYIKVSFLEDERHAADILALYNGRSSVRLFAHDSEALLLEGCPLGILSDEPSDEMACGILCTVACGLHQAVDMAPCTPNLLTYHERYQFFKRACRQGKVSAEVVNISVLCRIYERIIAETEADWCVLHGDLHPGNILKGERGWLAIDLKGMWGPLAHDYALALCTPDSKWDVVLDKARMERQAERISALSRIDKNLLFLCASAYAGIVTTWCEPSAHQQRWGQLSRMAAELAGMPFRCA